MAACKVLTSAGNPCRAQAIAGADVCRYHGGQLPGVKRKAAIRAEILKWGLEELAETVDPGEILLRLVTQSAKRCALYASLLEKAYEYSSLLGEDSQMPSLPGGVQTLIGGTWAATNDGHVYQTGEQIRGLVALEAQERDRCANFATKAIAAGLAERTVRIAESQGQAIIEAISLALDAAGVTGDTRARAVNTAADHLLAITGGNHE